MSISLSLKSVFTGFSITKMSNEELIQRYAKNKECQFLGQLYDNCERDLYYFLLTLTDKELAQEIAQHTWLKVIEKSHLYRTHGSFKSWLFTISRRCLIDEFRKQGRFDQLLEEPSEGQKVHDSASKNQDHDSSMNLTDVELVSANESESSFINQFNIGLSLLPFSQKEAFCLQQEGFSLAQIAQLTASESETVRSRIRYAKQALKKHLEKYRD
jgi:RNA polymerase sigma-70 factor (ECF subfamily)